MRSTRRFRPIAVSRLARIILAGALLALCLLEEGCKMSVVRDSAGQAGRENRLAREKSPYLLQHAANPVDWYPWGEQAFDKARREDLPVFLSIGYSTCHWCHVMAHESFEDPETASLLNRVFVCVKVDREERPDLDAVYMEAAQAMSGSGGWPLTVLLTPDKKPFFAGTYFPRESVAGRIGVKDLARRVSELWADRREKLLDDAERAARLLAGTGRPERGDALGVGDLDAARAALGSIYDAANGGFGTGTKFPTPHQLSFLLRHWRRTGDEDSLAMVERTLSAMASGGIRDHVGSGFHRYATDPEWAVPHFEKMLYDQAQIAVAYLEAFQATGRREWADTARGVFTYVLRDLVSPEGAFYTAEDADSEGEEGKFYVWTVREIRDVLGTQDGDLIAAAFGAREEGNFLVEASGQQAGANILRLSEQSGDAERRAHDFDAARPARIDRALEKLRVARDRRVRPHKDTKILVDVNGLMISALARGSQVLGDPALASAAARAAEFIRARMRNPDGRLLHRYGDGEAAVNGFAQDYAFLAQGLLDLYEAAFDSDRLQWAIELMAVLDGHFRDPAGGYFMTPDDGEIALHRSRDSQDGAVPAANSIAMLNLLRLWRITGDRSFEARAIEVGRSFSPVVRRWPAAFTAQLCAVDFHAGPSFEVVIAGGDGAADTTAMLASVRAVFCPNKVVLLRRPGDGSLDRVAPQTREQGMLGGRAAAYVCTEKECLRPLTDPEALRAELGRR